MTDQTETIFLDALADAVGTLDAVYPEGRTVDQLLSYLRQRIEVGIVTAGLSEIQAEAVRERWNRFSVAARHYRDLRFRQNSSTAPVGKDFERWMRDDSFGKNV